MKDIITFYRNDKNGETSSMFGYFDQGKFIVKIYREEFNSVSFAFWADIDLGKTLLDHVHDYFAKPGLLQYSLVDPILCQSNLGKYYPRIYRKGLDQFDGTNRTIFKNYDVKTLNQSIISCKILLGKMSRLFETVSFDEQNFNAFGHEIRNLLLLACMEVEAAWNGILSANGYIPSGRNNTTNDYVKLKSPLYLAEYEITFKLYPKIKIKPFESWDSSSPTKSLTWYDNYNKTKHDRENNENLATLQSAVCSVSATIIMLYAQFGPDEKFWIDSEFLDIKVNPPLYLLSDYYIPQTPYEQYVWQSENCSF